MGSTWISVFSPRPHAMVSSRNLLGAATRLCVHTVDLLAKDRDSMQMNFGEEIFHSLFIGWLGSFQSVFLITVLLSRIRGNVIDQRQATATFRFCSSTAASAAHHAFHYQFSMLVEYHAARVTTDKFPDSMNTGSRRYLSVSLETRIPLAQNCKLTVCYFLSVRTRAISTGDATSTPSIYIAQA